MSERWNDAACKAGVTLEVCGEQNRNMTLLDCENIEVRLSVVSQRGHALHCGMSQGRRIRRAEIWVQAALRRPREPNSAPQTGMYS
jgi:hypothetical protein